MRNYKFCIVVFFFSITMYCQNLTVNETIDYINKIVLDDSKIDLLMNGILTYSQPSTKFDILVDRFNSRSEYDEKILKQELGNKQTVFEIHISNIQSINILPPDRSWNTYSSKLSLAGNNEYASKFNTYWSDNEWTVTIKCKQDQIYHFTRGDGVKLIHRDGGFNNRKLESDSKSGVRTVHPYSGILSEDKQLFFHHHTIKIYTDEIRIRSNNGENITAQKINNAFKYLLDLAKSKGYDKKSVDDDPFAPNNFNSEMFDIVSS